eukprot:1159664-Pelagomonas_calceolata.AAC.10
MPPPNPPTTRSPHYPYNGGQRHNYGVLDVPEGCSLTAHIPGDEEVFAVLYTSERHAFSSISLEVYGCEPGRVANKIRVLGYANGSGLLRMGVGGSELNEREQHLHRQQRGLACIILINLLLCQQLGYVSGSLDERLLREWCTKYSALLDMKLPCNHKAQTDVYVRLPKCTQLRPYLTMLACSGPMFVPDSLGAAVWDGHGAIDLGVFDTDRDARQAAGTVLRLVMYHRHPLAGATGGGAGSGACNQGEPQLHHHHQYRAAAADGEEGEGGDPAFTAAAAAAAAAASNGEAHEAGHEDDGSGAQGGAESEQAQYNALFQWLAQYHQVTLVQGGEGEHGVDDGVEANTDANGCRPKSVRDEEGEHQTVGPSTKRARGRRGSMQSMVVPKEEAEGMMHGMDQVSLVCCLSNSSSNRLNPFLTIACIEANEGWKLSAALDNSQSRTRCSSIPAREGRVPPR